VTDNKTPSKRKNAQ